MVKKKIKRGGRESFWKNHWDIICLVALVFLPSLIMGILMYFGLYFRFLASNIPSTIMIYFEILVLPIAIIILSIISVVRTFKRKLSKMRLIVVAGIFVLILLSGNLGWFLIALGIVPFAP